MSKAVKIDFPANQLRDILGGSAQPTRTVNQLPGSLKRVWLAITTLVISDVLMVALAYGLAILIHGVLPLVIKLDMREVIAISPVYLLCIIAFATQGLYPSFGITGAEEARKVIHTSSVIFVVLGCALFMMKINYSRSLFLMTTVMATCLIPMGRATLRGWCSRRTWWGYPVVVFGTKKRAAGLIRALRARHELGLYPVAVIGPDIRAGVDLHGVPAFGSIEEAGPALNGKGLKLAVVALSDMSRGHIISMVDAADQHFDKVMVVPDFLRFGHLRMRPQDLAGMVGLSFERPVVSSLDRWAMGLLGALVVVVALPVLLPLTLVIAIAIKLTSPGPVFFIQKRSGLFGNTFPLVKFRTMYIDAETRLQQMLRDDPAVAAEYERMHKLVNDPRITPVGGFLRKSSLDEVPQLWNVLLGQMALVGPRPYMPSETGQMNGLDKLVFQVRPGLTGYWQVFARNRTTFHNRLLMDVYYVRNRSMLFDFYLLFRTFEVLLLSRGSH